MLALFFLLVNAAPQPVLSVGPIAGDRRIVLLVTETVKTGVARSPRVSLMEAKGNAGYQVVGSCLEHRGRMFLNFRVIDSKTGMAMRGVAVSGEATPAKFLPVVDALTQKLTLKLAGTPKPSPARSTTIAVIHPDRVRKIDVAARPEPGLARIETPSDRHTPIDAPPDTRRSTALHDAAASDGAEEPARPYTGVIIDARGLGLDRSMSPRIHREGGEVVWSGGEAEPDFVIDEGIVLYARSIEDAKRLRRAGSNPLILRAIERYDDPFHADPILANEDAAALMSAARKDGFLRKFNVVFVVD